MYDYIVVGAGSAGCVLAARLTENPSVSVLLLEAGPPDDVPEVHVPIAFSKLFTGPMDWNYRTEPQTGATGRRLYWPRGRTLGGSSALNAMVYIRGNRLDYDSWAAAGNPGWSYDDVLPWFRHSEDQERGASPHHGIDGPLSVADQRSPNPMSVAFIAAANEIGLPSTDDFNGPRQDGVGLFQVTQRHGARCSSATAFLKPARQRPNLTVETETVAQRLIVDGTRVVGVEVERHGQGRIVRAEREVLLCGGAVNSPQLLMLSGIGPADHLRAMGVTPVVDLPGVGANLQDHIAVPLMYTVNRPVSLLAAESPANVYEYLSARRGPMTSNIGEAGGFIRTRPELLAPDIQFHFAPVMLLEHGRTVPPDHGFTIGPTLLTPASRGHLRLQSADPRDKPVIDPSYLTAAEDLETLVEGLRVAQDIANAPALRSWRKRRFLPAPETVMTDAAARRHVRATVETLGHPVGTCAMGPDEMGVVDADLRVRGVDGLRVVDASVMPTIPRGNTNAPTIMLAEKAAAHLLARSPCTAPSRPA